MKENKIVGPLYWGDTYVIIANDVIKLDVHADGDYRFESGNIIKKEALRRLINASSAESVDVNFPFFRQSLIRRLS